MSSKHWDIFCNIVDNFGDIGVCWRLSQQLANEHHLNVRLFVDNFAVTSKIIPNFDTQKTTQTINQVEISAWPKVEIILPDVVIETFSCQLPDIYTSQIHEHQKPIIWINLEYLSAEKWVEDCHTLISTHPTLGIRKAFFYPGFTEKTGGLLREQHLIEARDAFCHSIELQKQFWQQNVHAFESDEIEHAIKISLFSYPQADIQQLILMLMHSIKPVHIFLPFNAEITALKSIIKAYQLENKTVKVVKKITLHLLPFLSQKAYDQLLWACDLNFVRGEDSWIRAIWAGKPFIWQPYIQDENTHLEKLNAFLSLYKNEAPTEIATLIENAHLVWSNAISTPTVDFWSQLTLHLKAWQKFSQQTSNSLAEQPSLTQQLMNFAEILGGEYLAKNAV